ncbi:hypothetical protein BDA99DRAFT_610006 [Phascolomyces articulosus]|uniref:Uncharacterized protein n=1 Tax=Phascolomyces articulosus TaxID=60185 RepID=A0AAD5P8W9_9FUNG|nr:hypothetical protein BDA99DRAFT_610006 [Phascolomyces articulosus]
MIETISRRRVDRHYRCYWRWYPIHMETLDMQTNAIYVLETPIITAATIAVVRADVFMNIVIYVLQEDVVTLETGNDLLENESFVIYLHKAVTWSFFK